jgi:hypothetical protein
MSKRRARARARSQDRNRQPATEASRGDPAKLVEEFADDVDADIRLLRADDTATEELRSLLGADNCGLPVALIEPLRNPVIQCDGGRYDIRLAIAVKMGLPLAGPVRPRVAAGWTLGTRQGKWELVDPTGTLVARCAIRADSAGEPAWTVQAVAADQILIAYGMRVGVRLPDGIPVSRYDDKYRAAELCKSLATRQASTAIVRLSQRDGAVRRANSS